MRLKTTLSTLLLTLMLVAASTVTPAMAATYVQDGTVYDPTVPAIKGPLAAPGVDCGPVDLVFIQDVTGSMGGAIGNVKADLPGIISTAEAVSGGDLSLGLVTFRDTVDVLDPLGTGAAHIGQVTTDISGLFAAGGADAAEPSDEAKNTVINNLLAGPRADVEGYVDSQNGNFNVAWRAGAKKWAILITDAPANGFSENPISHVPLGDATYNAHMASLGTDAKTKGISFFDVFVPTGGDYAGQAAVLKADADNSLSGAFLTANADGSNVGAIITSILATCGKPPGTIPEFPSIVLPIGAALGLVLLFSIRRREI